MSHAVLCRLREDSGPVRKELRLRHLEYIRAHRDAILAGGPTLFDDGSPDTMILLTRLDEAGARAFIAAEPYAASGRVFASVAVQAWSRVLPEEEPGALDAEIAHEGRESWDGSP